MRPPASSRRLAGLSDLLALPEESAVEIIAGEIVEKASPGFDHGSTQAGLSIALGAFRGGGGGPGSPRPGGWWLGTEIDVAYEDHEIYRHDVAGWRREKAPSRPSGRPVRLKPDWVCEILSPSNAANDTVKKLRVLHRHAVRHYWLIDPEAKTLRVLRWTPEGYLEALSATVDELVRAEPFEAIELSLASVLGLE